jgi:hypothetical protein
MNLFDSGVEAIGVTGDGSLFDLNGGYLYRWTAATGLNSFDSGVQSLACAGDGAVFVLASSGILQQLGADGQLHQVSFDLSLFTRLAAAADGTVYAQDSGGILYRYTPQVGWSSIGLVTSFAIGNDGDVYYLQNGRIYNATSGAVINVVTVLQGQPQPGVVALAQGPDGQLYVVVQWLPNPVTHAASESLSLYNPVTGSSFDFGDIQAFATDGHGNAYYLQNGRTLYDPALVASGQPGVVSPGVASCAFGPDGTVYYLTFAGNLYAHTPGAPTGNDPLLDPAPATNFGRVAGTPAPVRSFAVGADGSLDVLTRDGNLYWNGAFVGHTHLVIFPLFNTNVFVSAIVLDSQGATSPAQLRGGSGGSGPFGLGTIYAPWSPPPMGTDSNYWATRQGMAESMSWAIDAACNWVTENPGVIVGLAVGVVAGPITTIPAAATYLVEAVLMDQAIKADVMAAVARNILPGDYQQMAVDVISGLNTVFGGEGTLVQRFMTVLFEPTLINLLSDQVTDFSLQLYNAAYSQTLSRIPLPQPTPTPAPLPTPPPYSGGGSISGGSGGSGGSDGSPGTSWGWSYF